MADSRCEHCSFREAYDRNPNSLIGKIWRWHINWCPGWKKYLNSVSADEKKKLIDKYGLK